MGTHISTASRHTDVGGSAGVSATETARQRAGALFNRPLAARERDQNRDQNRDQEGAPQAHDPDPPRRTDPSQRRRPARPSWREAVFERLPLWVQLRCGLELKTVAAIAGVLAVAAAFAVHHFWTGRPRTIQVPTASHSAVAGPSAPHADADSSASPADSADSASSAAPSGSPPPSGGLVVDVAGKVRQPGVRRLPVGSRVIDALAAAGGALPGVDTGSLNLARVLADGEQVVVGQPAPPGAAAAGSGVAGSVTGTGAAYSSSGPVSLNSATAEQLDALPGVGPILARHIIEYRGQHGGFTSVNQLRQVSGVGQRKFDDLKSLVRP